MKNHLLHLAILYSLPIPYFLQRPHFEMEHLVPPSQELEGEAKYHQ